MGFYVADALNGWDSDRGTGRLVTDCRIKRHMAAAMRPPIMNKKPPVKEWVVATMTPTTIGAKNPPICPPKLMNPVKVPRMVSGTRSKGIAQIGPNPPKRKNAAADKPKTVPGTVCA